MRPVVDEDLCIGCGICVDICPEVFNLEDDGLSHVVDPSPAPDLADRVRESAEACPVDAITVEE